MGDCRKENASKDHRPETIQVPQVTDICRYHTRRPVKSCDSPDQPAKIVDRTFSAVGRHPAHRKCLLRSMTSLRCPPVEGIQVPEKVKRKEKLTTDLPRALFNCFWPDKLLHPFVTVWCFIACKVCSAFYNPSLGRAYHC